MYNNLFKRIIDFVLALFACVCLSPFYLLIMFAIKIDSKGPVFYRQKRITQYGKEFRIFKFRTMVQNADKIQRNMFFVTVLKTLQLYQKQHPVSIAATIAQPELHQTAAINDSASSVLHLAFSDTIPVSCRQQP